MFMVSNINKMQVEQHVTLGKIKVSQKIKNFIFLQDCHNDFTSFVFTSFVNMLLWLIEGNYRQN